MTLVEEYYELNEAEEVSVMWKVTQISFYSLAGCLGLWSGYTMALLRHKLDDKCYLFTSVKIPLPTDDEMYSIQWHTDSLCDYCQYSMVSSFMVATIWATFFLMCGKGGKSVTGLLQPWRIVLPSLAFNFIYFVIVLCTAINIQKGTDFFCLRQNFKTFKGIPTAKDCLPLLYLLKKDVNTVMVHLDIVVKTSWGCTISWLILFLIPLCRIVFVVDFDLYKICVFKVDEHVHNKKEEVLKITNYEEPKKLQVSEAGNTDLSLDNDSEKSDDVDDVNNRMGKVDKTMMSSNFAPYKIDPNPALYVDIRTINREKRKIPRSLDQAFEQNERGIQARKAINLRLKENQGHPRYAHGFYFDENEEETTSSRVRKPINSGSDSESESEIEVVNSDSKNEHSINIKKFM